jgi:hypothetical protein
MKAAAAAALLICIGNWLTTTNVRSKVASAELGEKRFRHVVFYCSSVSAACCCC